MWVFLWCGEKDSLYGGDGDGVSPYIFIYYMFSSFFPSPLEPRLMLKPLAWPIWNSALNYRTNPAYFQVITTCGETENDDLGPKRGGY